MLHIDFHLADPRWKPLLSRARKKLHTALHATFDAMELPERDFYVAVSFIDDAEIQTLNATHRSKDKPTNVLSFPLIEDFSTLENFPPDMPLELGDIVLAFETVAREAEAESKTLPDHTSHLLVHGLLHLFGYDHMTKKDAIEMEALEVAILEGLGISDPY